MDYSVDYVRDIVEKYNFLLQEVRPKLYQEVLDRVNEKRSKERFLFFFKKKQLEDLSDVDVSTVSESEYETIMLLLYRAKSVVENLSDAVKEAEEKGVLEITVGDSVICKMMDDVLSLHSTYLYKLKLKSRKNLEDFMIDEQTTIH